MKKTVAALASFAFLASSAAAQTPQPADWTTLTMTADLNKPQAVAWARIGGDDWCGIAKFLDIQSCAINSGKGEVGSLRTINGTIIENVVARSKYSYTYAQPFTPIFYHGTVTVEALTPTTSRLVYTLIWNQTAVGDAAAQAAARASRQQRFQAAVDKMAAAANAN